MPAVNRTPDTLLKDTLIYTYSSAYCAVNYLMLNVEYIGSIAIISSENGNVFL